MLCPDELRRVSRLNRRLASFERDPAMAADLIQIADAAEGQAARLEGSRIGCDASKHILFPQNMSERTRLVSRSGSNEL